MYHAIFYGVVHEKLLIFTSPSGYQIEAVYKLLLRPGHILISSFTKRVDQFRLDLLCPSPTITSLLGD